MSKSRSRQHSKSHHPQQQAQQGAQDFGSNADMQAKIRRVQKGTSEFEGVHGGTHLLLTSKAFADIEQSDLEDWAAEHEVIGDINLVDKVSDYSVTAFVPEGNYDTVLWAAKKNDKVDIVGD